MREPVRPRKETESGETDQARAAPENAIGGHAYRTIRWHGPHTTREEARQAGNGNPKRTAGRPGTQADMNSVNKRGRTALSYAAAPKPDGKRRR